MRIVICGSMAFVKQMQSAKEALEKQGHQVDIPELVEKYLKIKSWQARANRGNSAESARLKISHDLIRKHWNKIKKGDAILVLNYTKNKIKNYIGGNSFLEMGFAYILNKKIYLLNPIPENKTFYEEILAMNPIVLNGKLPRITAYESRT